MPAPTTSTVDGTSSRRAGQAGGRAAPGAAAIVAAGSGLVLIGSLFLDWYGYGQARATAWHVFTAADVLIALLVGVAVLATALARVRGHVPAVAIASAIVVAACGVAALTLVAVRVAAPPGPADVLGVVGVTIDASREPGAFVGLGAAVLMAGAGALAAGEVVLKRVSGALEGLNQDT